jgi:hypothetical protein
MKLLASFIIPISKPLRTEYINTLCASSSNSVNNAKQYQEMLASN